MRVVGLSDEKPLLAELDRVLVVSLFHGDDGESLLKGPSVHDLLDVDVFDPILLSSHGELLPEVVLESVGKLVLV